MSGGVVWYVNQGEVMEVEEDVARRARLDEVHARLVALSREVRLPETHASPGACKACSYLMMCDDDLWVDRAAALSAQGEGGEEEGIVYEAVYF